MQNLKISTPILLTPGPVPLSLEVKTQLSRDMTHHRSKEIKQSLERLQIHLKQIFHTKEHVYIINSTGTGAMEASITNTLSPGDEVLIVCGGKFGNRWLELAKTYHLTSHDIQVPWGQAVPVSQIEEKLKKHPKIKAIFVQACETSTAVFHPIKNISLLTQNRGDLLLIVDAVTALIVTDIMMDEWGVDVLIGGSQKSFALPAGLSFIALSKKASQFQKNSRLPAYYFDLEKERQANLKGQTAFSANVSFIRALDASLNQIIREGIKNHQKKYQLLAQSTQEFCQELGLKIFSSSPSLTAICVPKNIDGLKIKKFMEEQNIIVGGGQDQLKGKIIRFGHIGNIQVQHHIQGLKIFGLAVKKQNSQIFSLEKLEQSLLKAQNCLTHFKSKI